MRNLAILFILFYCGVFVWLFAFYVETMTKPIHSAELNAPIVRVDPANECMVLYKGQDGTPRYTVGPC